MSGKEYFSEQEFTELKNALDKEAVKKLISDRLIDEPMPMVHISRQEANDDFMKLSFLHDDMINGKWFTRYDYKYDLLPMYIPSSNIGNKSSNHFHQHSRWLADSVNSPSPYRVWTTEKFRLTLLNALWSLKIKEINSTTLRSAISLRKYIASQFRPSSAKILYTHFNAINVLDICSGWGDRLSGFMASGAESYTGVDPNARLVEGYQSQIDSYGDVSPSVNGNKKDITMISGCAEDQVYDRKFDFIFTSPPYYNAEKYTQEDNQSFKKFKKIDQWLEGFLFPSLLAAWNALEDGGHMAINISDMYSNHTINKICDPMNDYISSLQGARYYGCIGYKMAKRPNSGALKDKEGVFCEPIWIWRKDK